MQNELIPILLNIHIYIWFLHVLRIQTFLFDLFYQNFQHKMQITMWNSFIFSSKFVAINDSGFRLTIIIRMSKYNLYVWTLLLNCIWKIKFKKKHAISWAIAVVNWDYLKFLFWLFQQFCTHFNEYLSVISENTEKSIVFFLFV